MVRRNKRRRFSRLRQGALQLWRRPSEGLELRELWSQFRSEASAGYGFYSKAVDRALLERKPKWKHPFFVGWWLLRAMLGHLSPARRILLVVALLLIVLAPLIQPRFGLPIELSLVVAALVLLLLLAAELADRVTMKRDLEIAREIQSWLVPATPPEVSGVDIAFVTRPANTVGGDYYDVMLRGAGNPEALLLAVADVAGKSVPAALLMATLHASFRTLAEACTPLSSLVDILNRATAARALGGRRFITAFLAELDRSSYVMTSICAGHNAPILRRNSGDIERLDAGGLPLGVDPEGHFTAVTTALEAGDTLIIFTDGATDAMSPSGEVLGEPRLVAWTEALEANGSAEMVAQLMSQIDSFAGMTPQRDDITLFLLRRL